MRGKKAEGLTMNVIIIAALAIIVLLILVLIFTGQLKVFTGTLKSCTDMGGKCETGNDCTTTAAGKQECRCPSESMVKLPNGDCGTNNNNVCCKQILG
jgi:hypothetical protein